MVTLGRLFDLNNVPLKPSMKPELFEVEDCNLGTKEDPKFVKLSKTLSLLEKEEYVKIFKEFRDVFAWRYVDLKTYDTSVFQHQIPLNDVAKPFR